MCDMSVCYGLFQAQVNRSVGQEGVLVWFERFCLFLYWFMLDLANLEAVAMTSWLQ